MSSEGQTLFSGLFVGEAIAEATSERAWVQAMLDFEAALAGAEAEAGLIPPEAAEAIAAACDVGGFNPTALARDGRSNSNPAVPLVAAIRAKLDDEAAGFVHYGATSQDAIDTAAMLVASRAMGLIRVELDAVAAACAALADEHRGTVMAGRTLLQQAVPITFGLKAAGWLDSTLSARERLGSLSLAVQLGGAAGTLASLGDDGERVVGLLAKRLELGEPAIPWHTARLRVADLGTSLALAAGVMEKIALDLVLLSQTEVGEVAEPSGDGRGGSSTLPHKRNPVGSVVTIACARRVRGAAGVLLEAMAQEHERAAGAWQSEWAPLGDALALTGGAAFALREALEGLEVRPDRMRENLDASGGLLMAESLVTALAGQVGRRRARELIDAAAVGALDGERPLRDELIADKEVSGALSEAEIDRALDPAGYLGAADTFVDRALSRFREES
ncbi:MAG TPA: 3-carboxy-cis,cis-muconate cycloisomerase [Solirubrobacterales bacterium]|nr:3-carboxy-cis,cis-muconate cycloisomerase [Solirubrobacterales bacterium]